MWWHRRRAPETPVADRGDAVDRCRQRVQQHLHGHRGRSGDTLYGIRRVLRTGAALLTDRQTARLNAVLANEDHVQVEMTWWIYQRIVGRLPQPQPRLREGRTHQGHRHDQQRRPEAAHRTDHPRPHPQAPRSRRAGLLRPAGHQQRTDRGDQRPSGAPARVRSGLSEPDQLRRQIAAGDRRVQARPTPSIAMSRFSAGALRSSGSAAEAPMRGLRSSWRRKVERPTRGLHVGAPPAPKLIPSP